MSKVKEHKHNWKTVNVVETELGPLVYGACGDEDCYAWKKSLSPEALSNIQGWGEEIPYPAHSPKGDKLHPEVASDAV